MNYLFRKEASRPDKLPKLFRMLFKLALPHGGCAVTAGHEAAALWRPPEQWEIHWWQSLHPHKVWDWIAAPSALIL